MSTEPDIADDRIDPDQHQTFDAESRTDRIPFELHSVVVNYENRSDRRTVYPDGLSGVERMSAWLTADDDAFVNLNDSR